MPVSIEPRPTQTKIKHTILERYLKAWGGIILNGLKYRAEQARSWGTALDVHFVYVDCHAYAGRYDGEIEDKMAGVWRPVVWGSPVIGVDALDSLAEMASGFGIALRTNAILIEKDKATFGELEDTLRMKGWSARVRQTEDFHSLRPGEVAIVRADSTTMARLVTEYTQAQYTRAFYFLDPYGPKGIPLGFVREIVSRPRHDAIINMPYQDLNKKTGYMNLMEPGPEVVATLANFDGMYGHDGWREIARQLEDLRFWRYDWPKSVGDYVRPEEIPDAAEFDRLELELANMYKDSLQSTEQDGEPVVKSLPLRFGDRERTMFHLYLTTHDGTGALAMNQVIRDAKYQENVLRWQLQLATKQRKARQFDMFGTSADLMPAQEKVSFRPEEVGPVIGRRFANRGITRGRLYREMADDLYVASELDGALKWLKRRGVVTFEAP